MTEEELALSKIKARTIYRSGEKKTTMLGIFAEKLNDAGYIYRIYQQVTSIPPDEIKQWELHNQISHETMLKVLRQELVFNEIQQ